MEVNSLNKNSIVNVVAELCEPIVDKLDFELVDVEYVKEGPSFFLRIYIDKPDGITIDDCQRVSEIVSDKLDEVDPIEESYYLEVSSPGLDRPLKTDKDLKKNLGADVEVKLYRNYEGKKKYEGILLDFNDENIVLEFDENSKIEIAREMISKINLAVKF